MILILTILLLAAIIAIAYYYNELAKLRKLNDIQLDLYVDTVKDLRAERDQLVKERDELLNRIAFSDMLDRIGERGAGILGDDEITETVEVVKDNVDMEYLDTWRDIKPRKIEAKETGEKTELEHFMKVNNVDTCED